MFLPSIHRNHGGTVERREGGIQVVTPPPRKLVRLSCRFAEWGKSKCLYAIETLPGSSSPPRYSVQQLALRRRSDRCLVRPSPRLRSSKSGSSVTAGDAAGMPALPGLLWARRLGSAFSAEWLRRLPRVPLRHRRPIIRRLGITRLLGRAIARPMILRADRLRSSAEAAAFETVTSYRVGSQSRPTLAGRPLHSAPPE